MTASTSTAIDATATSSETADSTATDSAAADTSSASRVVRSIDHASTDQVSTDRATVDHPPVDRATVDHAPTDHAPIGEAVDQGVRALLKMQNEDGSWEGECVWCPMLAAQMVITSHLLDLDVSEKRRARLLRHFQCDQGADGLWRLHPAAEPSLFVTTLVYIAARLLGEPADASWLRAARELFAQEDGAVSIPTWGKFWLALMNLYDWDGMHPLPPELWRLPTWVPVHPANFYCHTRHIYLGMAVLYGARFSAPRSSLIDALRDELYPQGYQHVDFKKARTQINARDLHAPPSAALSATFRLSGWFEKLHVPSLRRRTLSMLRERLRWDLQTTDYRSLSPVNGLLGILALATEDRQDPDVLRGIETLESWVWSDDEEGARVAGARSVCWDTAFALQSLAALDPSRLSDEVCNSVTRASDFLKTQQITRARRDYEGAFRIDPRGGWCFSSIEHGWPVSDCTAEALIALVEAPQNEVDRDTVSNAVRFILRCQNRDGGFGSYEPQRSRFDLNWMNPSEMFGNCMTEQSYVECTASAVMAMSAARQRYPALMTRQVDAAIRHAVDCLQQRQNPNGSWNAAWGVQFIYGTMFGVRALRAADAPASHTSILRACRWLLAHQRADGGWGEDWRGCVEGHFVALPDSSVTQTAWALMTLVEAGCSDHDAMLRAAAFLAKRQRPDGEWPDNEVTGIFFETALLNYRLYRQYFPLWALACFDATKRSAA